MTPTQEGTSPRFPGDRPVATEPTVTKAAQDPLPWQVVRSWPLHTYPFSATLLYIFTLQAFWPGQTAKETRHCRGKETRVLPPPHTSLAPVLPWPQVTSLGQRSETGARLQGPQQTGEHSKRRALPG